MITTTSGIAHDRASRTDYGSLIVLRLYGDYFTIGKDRARLLGDDLKRVFDVDLKAFNTWVDSSASAAVTSPVGGSLAVNYDQVILPQHLEIANRDDRTGLYQEFRGMAEVLGVDQLDVLRAFYGVTTFGSTVFSATRDATADGHAIIGRNVDWDDDLGLRKPVLAIVHPEGDDLDYMEAAWPNFPIPAVGLNEAGLAISLNYFVVADGRSWTFTEWTVRRAIQRATTVNEAIEIIAGAPRRAMSLFIALADRHGDIALLECTLDRCSVFRPEHDWYGQANHARTADMIPYDLFRSPNSFARREQIERAVQNRLGRLDPAGAAEVLRDRAGGPYANASTVGNLSALNAVVVHPYSRTLWHATTMQPIAPFGEYVDFRFGAPDGGSPIAASPYTGEPGYAAEIEQVQLARTASHDMAEEKWSVAADKLAELLAVNIPRLDPVRLKAVQAYVTWKLGDAEAALAQLDSLGDLADAQLDLRIRVQLARGVLHGLLGHEGKAERHYREVVNLVDSNPQFYILRAERRAAERYLSGVKPEALPGLTGELYVPW